MVKETHSASDWLPEVEELLRRRALAARLGGPERIARQHAQGKLTVRERIDRLADPGSFREFLGLMGHGVYENGTLLDFQPKPAVEGICALDGRKVVISGGDFTSRGGSGGGSGGGGLGMELPANRRALEWRLPFVRLLDAAGGSVRSFEEIGRTYLPDGNTMSSHDTKLLRAVPVVSAVLGSVAGLPAVNACMAHFNVMVRGTAQLFPGGPPVVKAALGYDITKEELGGAQIHGTVSGVVDNVVESEDEAFATIRRFLSYLPSNVWEMAPRCDTGDDPWRRGERLLSIIPRQPTRAYDAHRVIDSVVDRDSFFEIAPHYGRARITGLARLNGYPVGVMANNAMYGGSTDVAGGEKVMRLIQLCDTFHLPLVSFADEPGFTVGLEQEKKGIERAGARLVVVTNDSQMPWVTMVMRQVYGVAGQCQHRPSGMFRRYAWPSANWGSMHIEGGAAAAYRREIEAAADREAAREEIEARLKAIASPFRTAEATGQDVIDPRDTRPLLCEFIEEAQPILRSQLGPTAVPYRP
jgi:acetyl-CoA carboxylase carboxyltransferase component